MAEINLGHVVGQAGPGVPAGGATGKVLIKKSGADYDTEWGDAGTSDALPLAGGTMSGAINMDGNKVSNLPAPTASGDAVPKGYADGLLTGYRTAAAQDMIDAGKQAKIAALGMLKGDGNGGVTAATAGTDYQAPLVAGTDYETPAGAKALGLTGAVVGDLARVAAVDANGRPTSWKRVALNEIKCNKNLLDNWYFVGGGSQLGDGAFPINQRGQTAYISGGYTIDRWIQYVTVNLVLESDGFRLGAIGNGCFLCNKLPGSLANDILGKIVTLSVLFENDGQKYLNYKSMTIPSSLPTSEIKIDAVDIDSNFTLSLQANSDTIFPMFFCETGVTANSHLIKAVKLELGSEQTLAHQENGVWVINEIPDYGEELAECQRYYYHIPNECNMNAVNRGNEHIIRFAVAQNFANTPSLILNTCYVASKNGLSGPFNSPATSVYSRNDAFTIFNVMNSGYQSTEWETLSIIFHNSYITAEI